MHGLHPAHCVSFLLPDPSPPSSSRLMSSAGLTSHSHSHGAAYGAAAAAAAHEESLLSNDASYSPLGDVDPADLVTITAMKIRAADEAVLQEMGYKQELHRGQRESERRVGTGNLIRGAQLAHFSCFASVPLHVGFSKLMNFSFCFTGLFRSPLSKATTLARCS